MICHIEAGSGIPIYEQIERQVKFAVANGSLLVGERIPSVRDLATQTAVNVNTVSRAYRELQQQGIVVAIRGTGLSVTPEAPEICQRGRLEMIRGRLRSVLTEAVRNEITLEEVRKMLDAEWTDLSLPTPDKNEE